MSSFAIIVDSSCDLPPGFTEDYGIEVLPMSFDLDGSEHSLGYWQEISGKEYYDALRNGSVAKTTLINPETFIAAYTKYAKEGKDALFVILSSGLSTTCQNAKIALEKVKESYPGCNIYSVDSLSASAGHGMLAMLAAKKREEGLSAGETAAWLEEKKHSCIALFTVDDLMYLHRGGRLSKLSAVAGSALGIKPVLNIAPDGTLQLKDKVRGRKAALKLMVSQMQRSIAPQTSLDFVSITHTDSPEDAQMFAEMIKAAVDVRNISVMMMGPLIGAHLGPGAVTLIFEGNMTRVEYENRFYS
jgi:DegV family protein with EDD domain